MALTSAQIKAVMAIPDSKSSLTPAQIRAVMAIDDGVSETNFSNFNPQQNMGKLFGSSPALAIKSGLSETMANVNRLLDPLLEKAGLPSYVNKTAQAINKNESDEFESSNPGIASRGLRGLTNIGSSALLTAGPEGKLISALGKIGIKITPELARAISRSKYFKHGVKSLSTAPAGAAVGALTSGPDEGQGMGAIIGGALSPIGYVGGQLAGKGIQALTKFNAIKNIAKESSATPEEIKNAIDTSGGLVPIAGNVLNNSEVQKMETNTLPTLPGFKEKSRQKLSDFGSMLIGSANKIADKLGGIQSKEDLNNAIAKRLESYEEKTNGEASDQYKKAYKAADDANFTVNQNGYKKAAQELYDELSQSSRDSGRNVNQSMMSELKGIIDNAPESVSLKSAVGNKSDWGDDYYKAMFSGDRKDARRYGKLQSALKYDIENALNESGNEDLRKLFNNAENFYKENIVPLKESGISGYLNGKKDTDTIVKTFLPSDKGRINLLKKILKNAPGSENDLMASVISDATDVNAMGDSYINPQKLFTKIGQLGPERLKILVKDPDSLKEIQKFQSNMKNGSQALELMFNPKNGFSNNANINMFESSKVISNAIDDALNGKVLSLGSKIAAYGGKSAQGRAINDPDLLKKIIAIKLGIPVKKGATYSSGSAIRSSGVPAAYSLTSMINGVLGNE